MNLVLWICMLSALLVCESQACSDDYFGGTIKCFSCEGASNNSSCGDPFTEKNTIDCRKGACLKWERLVDGQPIVRRTCSKTLDFQLIPINGVCRRESNGEGYICMCGTDECNHAATRHASAGAQTAIWLAVVMQIGTAIGGLLME